MFGTKHTETNGNNTQSDQGLSLNQLVESWKTEEDDEGR